MTQPRIVRTVSALRRAVTRYRQAGEIVALVPTMGALHDGHLSLVKLARRRARRVVVSIFVNPAQFGPREDFATYPRTWAADLAALQAVDVDLVWAPTPDVMYAADFATRVVPDGPAMVGLEDAFRPHFFTGVATVVAKLLIQCAPDLAIFGEKDYQQLKVVTRLVADLDLPVKIVAAATVRERDGLARSSRNAYLSPSERAAAPLLHRTLSACAARIAAGRPIARALADARAALKEGGFILDYIEARHAETLTPVKSRRDGPIRLLTAARLGKTRLIDNVAVPHR